MAELTIATVGAVALTEGIRFLYDQAAEVLRRLRERRDSADAESAEEDLEVGDGGVLDAPIGRVRLDLERAAAQHSALQEFRRALSDYVDGIEAVDPADPFLVESAEALRGLLETVYGRRITLRGEVRERSGASVDLTVVAESVNGYVAAVRARRVGHADIRAHLRIREVGQEGQAIAVDAEELGRPGP